MKYVIWNDIKTLIYKQKKAFFFYGFLPLFYGLLMFPMSFMDSYVFYDALGLHANMDNMMSVFLLIVNCLVYTYIALYIFTKDVKNGLDHIFLRMSSVKWGICKWVSIFLVHFFLQGITYIILLLLYRIPFQLDIILLFIKKIYYVSIVETIMFLLLYLYRKNKQLFYLGIMILVFSIPIIPVNISNISFFPLTIAFLLSVIIELLFYKYLDKSIYQN